MKILISHPMESGQRHDDMGQPIPRDIINNFVCTYNGETVLRADLFPAIAANPFFCRSRSREESGTIGMTFTDDHGAVQTETRRRHRRMICRHRVLPAALVLCAASAAKRIRLSGCQPRNPAMQDDDAANPGFLWVQQGEALWSEPAGATGKSCADCHADAATSMRGVAARYPAV